MRKKPYPFSLKRRERDKFYHRRSMKQKYSKERLFFLLCRKKPYPSWRKGKYPFIQKRRQRARLDHTRSMRQKYHQGRHSFLLGGKDSPLSSKKKAESETRLQKKYVKNSSTLWVVIKILRKVVHDSADL